MEYSSSSKIQLDLDIVKKDPETETDTIHAEELQRNKKKAYNRQYKASMSKEQRALYKANERLRAKTKNITFKEDHAPLHKRRPRRVLTEEQRLRKIEADHIYRASLTDEQRERIRAKYRERTRTMTEEQRERRQAAQRKYHASLTKEQRSRRKMRERERLKLKEISSHKNDEVTVEPFKRWTMLTMEQREKREICPRTYGSTISKEQRELKRLKLLESSNLPITLIKKEPSETLDLNVSSVIKIENNSISSNDLVISNEFNNTIKEEVEKEPNDLFESNFVKNEKSDTE